MTGNYPFDDTTRRLAGTLARAREIKLMTGLLARGVATSIWPARRDASIGANRTHAHPGGHVSACGTAAELKDWTDPNNSESTCRHGEDLERSEFSTHLAEAVAARRKLFVHAGVVGWRGQAIVIPGRSMTGKSELVAALLRAGASYYSDEFAVFDKKGYVHPYHKPLTLRRASGGQLRNSPVEVPSELVGSKKLPVGLIFVGAYHEGAQWNPRTLTPGEAVLEMFDNTVLARYRPDLALAILQRVALGALALKSQRGNADDVAPQVLDRLANRARSS
jgi:hypothetical protein